LIDSTSGQDFYTRRKRGEAISQSREKEKVWKEEHTLRGDPEVYRREILPELERVTLSQIMGACGVAKSTASGIRSGKRVPSARHWEALRSLCSDIIQH
jgi:hypothetical protein